MTATLRAVLSVATACQRRNRYAVRYCQNCQQQVLVLPRSKTASGEPSVPESIEVDLPAAPRPGTADGADARRGEEGDAGDGGGVLDTTQHKQLQRQEDLSEK